MKKIKSYIFASILGLFNVIPGNANAKFVENKNFPYFYDQADHLVDGIHWFKSKTNPNKVFYTLPREIDLLNEKKWKFVCGENNKFLKELKKYHFVCMELDNDLKEVYPNFYEDNEENFYRYLYKTYQDANCQQGKLPENLMFDNPLDNLGWFYNGLCTGNDLLDRVRSSKRPDKNIEKLNMFAINTGNENQKAFKVPSGFNPDITQLHPWIQNVYKFFKENVYLQHGEFNDGNARGIFFEAKDRFANDNSEANRIAFKKARKEYDEFLAQKPPIIIDSYSNMQKLQNKYSGSTTDTDAPLQNHKHVFFSPIVPGFENYNSYRTTYLYFNLIDNNNLFDLPLVNVSCDMKNDASLSCYIGSPEDVLKMLINDLSIDRSDDNQSFFDQVSSWEQLQNCFAANEIRIPVYIFPNHWYKPTEYFQKPNEKMKQFGIKYDKYCRLNNKKNKLFNVDDPSKSNNILYPTYNI